jgi:hypothetical protein
MHNAKTHGRKDAKIDTEQQAWAQRFAKDAAEGRPRPRTTMNLFATLHPCVFALCCSASAKQLPSGEISRVTYPTCGQSRYFYGTKNIFDWLLNKTVPEHWVTSYDTGAGSDTRRSRRSGIRG